MPAPLPDSLLLPDAFGLLPFLCQALLLQAGHTLGRRNNVDAPRRLTQTICQAPGAFWLLRLATVWGRSILTGFPGCPQLRCKVGTRVPGVIRCLTPAVAGRRQILSLVANCAAIKARVGQFVPRCQTLHGPPEPFPHLARQPLRHLRHLKGLRLDLAPELHRRHLDAALLQLPGAKGQLRQGRAF